MRAKTICSVDVGLKRIGLALKLKDSSVVLPQEPILRRNRKQASKDLSIFLADWKVDILVVGLPSNSEMQKRVKHFVMLLDFCKKIEFFDEDFSSFEAREISKGILKHKKDGKIDSIAAKIILERYLEKGLAC